jgi:hypothetical protein
MSEEKQVLSAVQAKKLMDKYRREKEKNPKAKENTTKFSFSLKGVIPPRELVIPELGEYEKRELIYSIKKDAVKEGYSVKVPNYLAYDIFSLFNNELSNVKIKKYDEENKWQFALLNKVNNYLLRPLTENSNLYTYITTYELIKTLNNLIKQKIIQQNKESNGGKSESPEEILKKMFSDKEPANVEERSQKKSIENAIDKAVKEIETKMKSMQNSKGVLAGKGDDFSFSEINVILDYLSFAKNLNLSNKQIGQFIKKSLKFASNYFSNSFKTFEESILDSDDIEDIVNIEDLANPVFSTMHLEDIMTTDKKFSLAFDIYVDISGSMVSLINFDSNVISALDLCKITSLKLNEMGFVKDVYVFNDIVRKMNDTRDVLKLTPKGGTKIELVIEKVKSNNRPSVIITDMKDTVFNYSENIYFIGVAGAKFSLKDKANQYKTKKQLIVYNNGSFSFPEIK